MKQGMDSSVILLTTHPVAHNRIFVFPVPIMLSPAEPEVLAPRRGILITVNMVKVPEYLFAGLPPDHVGLLLTEEQEQNKQNITTLAE